MQMNELSAEVARLKAVIQDRESAFPAGQVDPADEELAELRGQLAAAKEEYKACSARCTTRDIQPVVVFTPE